MDENEEREELRRENMIELQHFQNELLFSVQGVSQTKTIEGGYDVKVKGTQCEESLKDIHKYLRHDGNVEPNARLILGEW